MSSVCSLRFVTAILLQEKGDFKKKIQKKREKNKTVAQSTVVVLHETIPCLFFRCYKMARERLKLGRKYV